MLEILNIRHINNHHSNNIKQMLLYIYGFICYPAYLFIGRSLKRVRPCTEFVCLFLHWLDKSRIHFFEWIYKQTMLKKIMCQKVLVHQVFHGDLCSFHLHIVNTFFEVSKYTANYLREETTIVCLYIIYPLAHWWHVVGFQQWVQIFKKPVPVEAKTEKTVWCKTVKG